MLEITIRFNLYLNSVQLFKYSIFYNPPHASYLSHEGSQKIEYKFITQGKSKTLNTNLSHEGSQKIEYKFITRGKPKH